MSAGPAQAPRFRMALLGTLAVGVLTSASALQGAAIAFSVEQLTAPQPTLGPLARVIPYAREQEAALKAHEQARLAAIESMASSRALVLSLLALGGLLLFLGAAQIRWAEEAPWVGLADRLAWVATGAAVLRTVDGAQELVIVRRAADASTRALARLEVPDAVAAGELSRALFTVLSVGWTAAVVALLLGLSAYFRSPGVRSSYFVAETPE
jgi:hypothetical protein